MTIAKLLEMSRLPFEQERWERACTNEAQFGAMSGFLYPVMQIEWREKRR
ncbi:hypothetical protein [Selenomonas sputigena]|nr:hypothetical protein [Selenomonas sputigena]